MQLRRELQFQLLRLMSGMILMNVIVAAASRPDTDSELRPGGPGCVDCQSSRDFPTFDVPLPYHGHTLNDVLQRPDDVTKLRHPGLHVGAELREDHPDRRRRRRRPRSVRATRTVELAETSRGQLLTLGNDYAERFAFKDPAPQQLDISAVMGNVLLRDGHRLDFETQPELKFVIIVTRVDDVACECFGILSVVFDALQLSCRL